MDETALPNPPPPRDRPFPIVGLGASAGGLEALERFFRKLPQDSGLAFVVVPHLDPGHASILTEILQRATPLPVVEAQDQMVVAPDRVYVIPPNRDMAIFHNALQLSVPEAARAQRMPIDFFLRSLAEERGERAIGVILSGTGTDGTLGLRAIHGVGGISLVQDPAEAAYNGMPESAIRAGFATYVLPVEKMPAQLLVSARSLDFTPVLPPPTLTGSISKILLALRSGTGHDFALYKQSTIRRRIERRMALHGIEDTEVYVRFLREHPGEVQLLFKEILIGVTSFFRDPEAFAALKAAVLPRLFDGRPEGQPLRVWVAACSTGEEAYSIAICLREYMDETGREHKVQIYATDIDESAITEARVGTYPPNIAADVTAERLRRFFIREEAGYRVKKDIREMIVFASQNVIKDPPFTRIDLLSCRNLLIYLEPELQNRLIPAFHYALRPGGVLFLSPSESIGSHSELFMPVDRKWKLYQARGTAAPGRTLIAHVPTWQDAPLHPPDEAAKKGRVADLAELARRVLLQSYAPPSVVTDAKGNILYVYGDTGTYLRPAPGQASLNVIDMAREGLQLGLRAALHDAVIHNAPAQCRNLEVRTNGDIQIIDLIVRPLADGEPAQGLLVVSFQDVAREKHARKRRPRPGEGQRVEELERELAYTRENLQATIEEQQATNEELKSANEEMQSTNEELQSTNEELQSTNEELETSKEELQSVNEELQTVNAELQSKIEQLAGLQNDMKNLFDSINVGVVFLDTHLVIRRFTKEATRAFRLVASDVGRPLADIKSDLLGLDLLAEAEVVLETLMPRELEMPITGERWLLTRLTPYRTLENVIDGVVLTFTDITLVKIPEEALKDSEAAYHLLFDRMRNGLAYCRMEYEGGQPRDFAHIGVNLAFEAQTGLKGVIGRKATEVMPGIRESNPELFTIYGRVARGGGSESFEAFLKPLGRWLSVTAYCPKRDHFVAVFEDISERKHNEAALQEGEARFRAFFDAVPHPLFVLDDEGRVLDANHAAAERYGYSHAQLLSLSAQDLAAPGLRDQVVAQVRQALGGEIRFVWQHRDREGREFPVEIHARPFVTSGKPCILSAVRERSGGETEGA